MKRLRLVSLLILLVAIGTVTYIRVQHGQASDSIAPKITMNEDAIKISVKDGEDVLLEGVTAEDNRDGDVTDSITIDNISTFNGQGKRYVTIAAFDSRNNVGKVTREITYSDYRSPHFDITEPLVFRSGDNKLLENITANCLIDGDLTGQIHFSDNTTIYTDTEGTYEALIQVQNSAGDTASLPISIQILDDFYDRKPSVKLKHYVRYIKKNKSIDYKSLMEYAVVNNREYEIVDGDDMDDKTIGRDLIRINDDNVNYEKTGNYYVEYKLSVEDGEETQTGTTRLIVVVED